MNATKNKKRLLFICLGNICRSPAAHAVMQKMVDDRHLTALFEIDSAGIGDWHVGQLPDRRRHGERRSYRVDHPARQFKATSDFDRFDHIIVMDEENYRIITGQARTREEVNKVTRMADYFNRHDATTVLDPYYGGDHDFELALDLIEDGCEGLLEALV
ncbi:low molecular weight phosphotyrosine protein phosphatase [Prevotella sp. A2931]|uniref:protein-tyrosine-phosphatase n=1 Tax=Prevotella illustrans TaxID=2800387 RepID=A0ABS3M743_9BACT|nr:MULTISPECIES: low molecular weight protein-tyrosine-phosphatase [Prevotella]MBO1363992.1 low molecular weight phosphotyrosine protein phosphatase [Prevotella illustrans]PTL27021.1 low molecular weight phosphotyrosine protein phosphatase [Prevotella sp. oral taxon 820]